MSSNLTTAEYIARIDPVDLHLLTETVQRVSDQLELPRIRISFTTASNSPSETKSLFVSVENSDGKCSMHFALWEKPATAEENPVAPTSGAK